jgi:hypothetical protein
MVASVGVCDGKLVQLRDTSSWTAALTYSLSLREPSIQYVFAESEYKPGPKRRVTP